MNRELSVSLLAALLLTFTAWAWGGVVLWTQWVVAGLGLLTLAVALMPDARSAAVPPRFVPRAFGVSLGLGALVAACLIWVDLDLLLTQRAAARELIPGLNPEPLRLDQWGLRGLLSGVFTSLASLVIAGLVRPSEQRGRLVRFLPFWAGLFLFAWIACQSWNTWGVVVQRDLHWRILPREHITWLPSGLDAPFFSDEEPGGMNGWRQLLILIGPWALLCALVSAAPGRSAFAWLSAVACINGLGVAAVGNVYRANNWTSYLGVDDPDLNVTPFGPFIYKNHAGAYVYLAAGLTLALVFYLAKRRGDKADRGGPHLVAALAFVFLVLGSASTMSIGSSLVAAALVLVVAPLAFFCDRRLRANLSPIPAMAIVGLAAVVVYAGLLSTDAKKWRLRLEQKQQALVREGADDRAPLRRASLLMIETSDASRRLSGWGAGSYRWVSPGFLKTQPEFLNRRGELAARATHAHNDWLQAPIEWGLAGLVVILALLAFIADIVRQHCKEPRAPAGALLGVALLFAAHAFLDFLLFTPHLSLLAVIFAWIITGRGRGHHAADGFPEGSPTSR